MAYLSRRQTAREAQELAVSYGQFLLNFGGQNIDSNCQLKMHK